MGIIDPTRILCFHFFDFLEIFDSFGVEFSQAKLHLICCETNPQVKAYGLMEAKTRTGLVFSM